MTRRAGGEPPAYGTRRGLDGLSGTTVGDPPAAQG